MIRILSIVWFKIFPPRFGGQKGIALFNKYLSLHFELICLCSDDNKLSSENYPVKAELPAGKKQFLLPFTYIKIIKALKTTGCTHVILEHPYHGAIGILSKKLFHKKLVIHSHNIEYLLFRKQGNKWWWILFYLEKLTYQNANLVFFKTEDDMNHAKYQFGISANKCTLIPYGIERQAFDRKAARKYLENLYQIDQNKKIILFAATLDYLPNAEAVESIFNNIAPGLDTDKYCILICGRNKKKEYSYLKLLKAAGIIYCGETDEIDLYFAGADAFINPVTKGGGIQSKIIDALSYHLNVVCFSNMLNGIDTGICSEKLFIAQDNCIVEFINLIPRACEKHTLTPDSFFEKYEWKNIAASAAEAIRRLN